MDHRLHHPTLQVMWSWYYPFFITYNLITYFMDTWIHIIFIHTYKIINMSISSSFIRLRVTTPRTLEDSWTFIGSRTSGHGRGAAKDRLLSLWLRIELMRLKKRRLGLYGQRFRRIMIELKRRCAMEYQNLH